MRTAAKRCYLGQSACTVFAADRIAEILWVPRVREAPQHTSVFEAPCAKPKIRVVIFAHVTAPGIELLLIKKNPLVEMRLVF